MSDQKMYFLRLPTDFDTGIVLESQLSVRFRLEYVISLEHDFIFRRIVTLSTFHPRCHAVPVPLSVGDWHAPSLLQILSAISVVYTAVNLYQLDSGHDMIVKELNKLYPDEDVDQVFQQARSLLVVRLCAAIFFTLFSAVLVLGVYRENRQLVLIFVIFYWLYLLAFTIAIFYAFYDPSVFIDQITIDKLRKQDADVAKAIIYIALFVQLGVFGFFYYLAVVVFSYYKELERTGPTKEHRQLF